MSNFKYTQEHKVMRDPVHGYINVHYQVIWDLINAPEFQRLRRIHQLGGTFTVYHTAEHSRFSHSLGVYEIVRLMIENIQGMQEALSEFEKVAVLCAGLLHDLGHGPFSHSFEAVTKISHEAFTDRIILEDSAVNRILKAVDESLPQVVADIIAHRHPRILLSQMISSQMDADRMDYLLRDSYFTGVSYGEFDLYRILRTIRIVNDTMVVKESGIHAIEDYIMARYQMYWQVYLHPTSRSYESILHSIFKRMRDMYAVDPKMFDKVPVFVPFLKGKNISLKDHFRLDESSCLASFMTLTECEDPILSDLTTRLLNRDLFKYKDIESELTVAEVESAVSENGHDPRYYVMQDFMSQTLYLPYRASDQVSVWVLVKDQLLELSNVSSVVKGFVRGEEKEDRKVFFPSIERKQENE